MPRDWTDFEPYDPDPWNDDISEPPDLDLEDLPIDGVGFAREGSALRAASPSNPRIFPCPTCGAEDVLTRIDVQRHYQCDRCADIAERGGDY